MFAGRGVLVGVLDGVAERVGVNVIVSVKVSVGVLVDVGVPVSVLGMTGKGVSVTVMVGVMVAGVGTGVAGLRIEKSRIARRTIPPPTHIHGFSVNTGGKFLDSFFHPLAGGTARGAPPSAWSSLFIATS
jgi:hypothetical protein